MASRASSFINNPGHPLSADLAFDGDPATAWNENARGPGNGEWIEAQFGSPMRLRRLHITTGWDYTSPRHGDLFAANSHLRRVRITFDGGSAIERDVGPDERTLDVDVDVTAESVRIQALDVYRGARWADLCISEVGFEGNR